MRLAITSAIVAVVMVIGWPWAFAAQGNRFQQNNRTEPLQLSARHDQYLQRWLATHPNLRAAHIEDCEDRWTDSAGKEHVESCQRLIEELRAWSRNSAVNPFYAKGDFNGDGEEDFAVVLTDRRPSKARVKSATVVVFNGPFQATGAVEPAFSMVGRFVSKTFLGYGPPRPKPWHLIIGSPESEGRALVWRNGAYVLR